MPEPEKKSKIKELLKIFSSQHPELEVNLVAYGWGVLVATGWLTVWFWRGPRDANLVAALGVFMASVTGGLFRRGSNEAQQAKGAGDAPGKDGEA